MKWNSVTNKPVVGTFQGKIDTTKLESRLGYYFGFSDYANESKRQVKTFVSEAITSYTKGNLSFSKLEPKLQRYAAKVLFELRFPEEPHEYRFICDLIDNCKIECLCRLCYCDIIETTDLEYSNYFKKAYCDFLHFIADGCIDGDALYHTIYPLHVFFTLDDYKELVKMSSILSVRETILNTIIELQEDGEL